MCCGALQAGGRRAIGRLSCSAPFCAARRRFHRLGDLLSGVALPSPAAAAGRRLYCSASPCCNGFAPLLLAATHARMTARGERPSASCAPEAPDAAEFALLSLSPFYDEDNSAISLLFFLLFSFCAVVFRVSCPNQRFSEAR
eukprot:m.287047 g.287047  ORF g.287047 m.287047 type:complete len:142 (-) comp11695_c0_seq1:19-444(-)